MQTRHPNKYIGFLSLLFLFLIFPVILFPFGHARARIFRQGIGQAIDNLGVVRIFCQIVKFAWVIEVVKQRLGLAGSNIAITSILYPSLLRIALFDNNLGKFLKYVLEHASANIPNNSGWSDEPEATNSDRILVGGTEERSDDMITRAQTES